MSAFSILAVGLVAAGLAPASRRLQVMAWLSVLLVIGPVATVLAIPAVVAGRALGRIRARRRSERRMELDAVDLARFLLVGTGAGWTLERSLHAAAIHLDGPVRAGVETALRDARLGGLAPALLERSGPAGDLFRLLARSHLGGVPVRAALDTYIQDAMARRRAAAIERARRLPVRMVVPLTLLMLPGFVVLVAGPTVLMSARRLLGPLLT